jgi:hypothetical protein
LLEVAGRLDRSGYEPVPADDRLRVVDPDGQLVTVSAVAGDPQEHLHRAPGSRLNG